MNRELHFLLLKKRSMKKKMSHVLRESFRLKEKSKKMSQRITLLIQVKLNLKKMKKKKRTTLFSKVYKAL